MSQTRLICPGCGFIEIYCECSPDKDPGENTQGHRFQAEKNALKDEYLNAKAAHQGDNPKLIAEIQKGLK